MASKKLFFIDLSESKGDSQHGSSSERGVDPNLKIVATSGRGIEATEPLEFGDEQLWLRLGRLRQADQVEIFLR